MSAEQQKIDYIQKQIKVESYPRDDQNKSTILNIYRIDELPDEAVPQIDQQDPRLDNEGTNRNMNVKKKSLKSLYYKHALQVQQTPCSTVKDGLVTQDGEVDSENLMGKQENQEFLYLEALENFSTANKNNFLDIFHVVHKDEFEMLKIYNDQYPLLWVRKKILWVMKFISYSCYKFIKSKPFEIAVICIILFNTAVLMMVDPTVSTQTPLQDQFDNFFLIAYTVEMGFKILGLGFILKKGSYLRDGWNILDFVIVVSSLLPLVLGGNKSISITSLRSLRILRPLRAISSIRALQTILNSLFSAIPFLIDTFIVLFFYFLIFAIAGLQLFKGVLKQRCIDPTNGINYFQGDEEFMCGGAQECNPGPGASSGTFYGNGTYICAKMLKNPYHGQNFDNIFYSLLLVYQSATLEGWSNTMYWIAQTVSVYTLAYHLVLVFVGANVIINLTLAVISAKFAESQQKIQQQRQVSFEEGTIGANQDDQKHVDNKEKQIKEKSSSSDSEEVLVPSLEIMKNFNREKRINQKKDNRQVSKDTKLLQSDPGKNLRSFNEQLQEQQLQINANDEPLKQVEQYIFGQNNDYQRNQLRIIINSSTQRTAIETKTLNQITMSNYQTSSSQIIKINSKNEEKELSTQLISPKAISSYSNHLSDQIINQIGDNSYLPIREDQDEVFNDPNFLEVENLNKDQALAQAVLQQTYNSKRGEILQIPMQQRTNKSNPKKRGSQKQFLMDIDDNNTKQKQEFIQLTNDNNIKVASSRKHKKRDRIQGKFQDYKLVLTIDQEYFSSSKNDVIGEILVEQEEQRNLRLLQQIKDRHYTFFYASYEQKPIQKYQDLSKQITKIPSDNQHINDDSSFQDQFGIPKQSNHLLGEKLGSKGDIFKEGIQIIQNNRVPVTKGGQIRKQLYEKIKKLNKFDDNFDQILQNDKSLKESRIGDKSIKNQNYIEQTLFHKITTIKKRRGHDDLKNLFDLHDYSSAKRAFNEPFEETMIPLELPADKLYLQILQTDFTSNVKTALHWSGEEVMIITRIPSIRANKVRQKLDSSNQIRLIHLAGIEGFLLVRHNELQEFVKGHFFNSFILVVVVGNTVLLSLAGSFTSAIDLARLETCNSIFTYIFISEMGIKLIAFGPQKYLRDRMNIIDGSIVLLSILEITLFSSERGKAFSAFRAIRIFRVLRITRLMRSLKFMGIILKVVNNTLENFIYICFLMFLFVIIYSLLGMQIYGGKLAYRGNKIPQNWDNFLYAFLATYQGLTIENWDDLLQITLESSVNKFLSVIYLISWVIIGNYVFLNLFLAVLMDGFCSILDDGVILEEDVTNEDQNFMKVVSKALLDSNYELAQQKKANDYQIEVEKKNLDKLINHDVQIIRQYTSQIEDELNLDLVNHKFIKPIYDGIECETSLFMFDKNSPLRILCYKLVMNHFFEQVILGCIVVSSFKLAIDTYLDSNSTAGNVSAKIDIAINAVFICEATLKIIALGFFIDEKSYLRESWSQLDFFIVSTSVVDMLFSNVNIPFIKILRLLRILRPLRFITHNVNLKIIVIALFESMGGMLNVGIVVGLIWLMFAILGISLLGGKFGSCTIQGNLSTPNFGISIDKCSLVVGNQWFNFLPNMDNIYNAMIMVFILTTLEGWPNILYPAMNSDTSDKGPSLNANQYVSFYFVAVILVSAFVLINLFTGVVCFYFQEAHQNEKKRGNIFLTQEQENWIEIQTMTIGVGAGQSKIKPQNKIRAAFFCLVEQGKFDVFIMICICLNVLTMAMDYDGRTINYNSILENINLAFTSVFIAEAISKIIAFGITDYISSGWNKFDLFVVSTSILDIILNLSAGSTVSFLRVGPQLIRIVRVLRVTRLLKLIKSMKSLQKLLQTLLYSLPALLNIGALTFLVFFIFSILGVFIFQSQPHKDQITTYNNFDNFGLAMLTLYRVSTGENWEWIMFDYTPNQVFAPLYFMIFLVVSTWVMLNLFTLVIMDYFENYSMKSENPLELFTDNLEVFRKIWLQFTQNSYGEKLNQKHLITFFQALPHPIGFLGNYIKRPVLAKQIMSMQLIGDGLGNVYFNELLYAAIKRAFGEKIFGKAKNDLNLELQLYLIKVEQETRGVIELNKINEFKKKKSDQYSNKKSPINPLTALLLNRMIFLAWRNYSIKKYDHQSPNFILEAEENNTYSYELQEQINNSESDELSYVGAQQLDDDRVEEMEDEFSPSIEKPSQIMRPLNIIQQLGRQLQDQQDHSNHNFSFQANKVRNVIYPKIGGQHQQIITEHKL